MNIRINDADHGGLDTAVAELRTVVPDGVCVVDGDNKGHVGGGYEGGHVAGVDAIRCGVAWFVEADGLRDGMVLIDDIFRLILLRLILLIACAGLRETRGACSVVGILYNFSVELTHAFHVVELHHISHGGSHTIGIENKVATITNTDHDGLRLALSRQARDADQEAEDLHHDGKLKDVRMWS